MILGIYGASGLGREILDLAHTINAQSKAWEKIVFIDDSKRESIINSAKVYTFDSFQQECPPSVAKIVIAVGEPAIRRMLRDKVTNQGYALQTLVHPAAFVGAETKIGDGTIIQYGSFVSCNTNIGMNVLVQPNSSVGHDCDVGNEVVLSSYVGISGTCTVGEQTYIGVSVPVRENSTIGAHSIIGMGSVVLRDIPEGVIAMGNPARVVKKNEDERVFK